MVSTMALHPHALLDRFAGLAAAAPLGPVLAGRDLDVWLVGGAVRDLALGRVPGELDLLVESDPATLAAALAPEPGAVRSHPRFQTVTATRDGFTYDIARARAESYPHPGALPEIRPAPVAADLARRDFTVNALALGIAGTVRGRLAAADGAIADLENGVLRVLHEASFRDDPTRLLRLARYAARLGFAIAPGTLTLAHAAARDGALSTISGDRIGAELWLLAGEEDPVAALRALARIEADRALAPGFGITGGAPVRRALALLGDAGDRRALVLGAASLGLSGPERDVLLPRLGYPAATRDTISAASARAAIVCARLAAAGRPSAIAAAAAAERLETVALAGAVGDPGGAAERAARAWLDELRHIALMIGGDELIAAGATPGPGIGAGLRAALAARLDGEALDREAQLAVALAAALA